MRSGKEDEREHMLILKPTFPSFLQDPSMLYLEHVSRSFHGNYTCQGATEAGWSQMSEEKELEIYCKCSM